MASRKSRVDTDALFKNLTGQSDAAEPPKQESVESEVDAAKETLAPQVKRVTKKAAPAGYKANPEYVEIKSRRAFFLLRPSLHDKLRQEATRSKVSINELLNSILETRYR